MTAMCIALGAPLSMLSCLPAATIARAAGCAVGLGAAISLVSTAAARV